MAAVVFTVAMEVKQWLWIGGSDDYGLEVKRWLWIGGKARVLYMSMRMYI